MTEPTTSAAPSGTVGADVRPWWEPTSRGYEVTGPDKDGDMCIEFDTETNIIWLTRRDVEMLLARWPNAPPQTASGAS
jgi:hypothetical protein